MSTALDLNLLPIQRRKGQDQSDFPGLYAATPPRRTARGRDQDKQGEAELHETPDDVSVRWVLAFHLTSSGILSQNNKVDSSSSICRTQEEGMEIL